MSGEFDSRKDSQSTKLERRPRTLESCAIQNDQVYMLLIIWPKFIKFRLGKNRKVGCEFMRTNP